MNLRTRITRLVSLSRDERGAEAVEFAIIGPIMFFVLLGMLYVLLLFAAQLSVARSATVGVRYASIVDQSTGTYPTVGQINSKVLDNTSLFKSGACTTTSLTGGAGPNDSMKLSVSCDFPNPAGQAVSGLKNAFFGGGGTDTGTLVITADATARKE